MNQRICFYASDLDSFRKIVDSDKISILHSTNKYRPCLFLENENSKTFESINRNSVIHVHEILTHSFTYTNTSEPSRIDELLVDSQLNKIWVGDVDIWIGLSPEITDVCKKISGHTFFQSYPHFFLSLENVHV